MNIVFFKTNDLSDIRRLRNELVNSHPFNPLSKDEIQMIHSVPLPSGDTQLTFLLRGQAEFSAFNQTHSTPISLTSTWYFLNSLNTLVSLSKRAEHTIVTDYLNNRLAHPVVQASIDQHTFKALAEKYNVITINYHSEKFRETMSVEEDDEIEDFLSNFLTDNLSIQSMTIHYRKGSVKTFITLQADGTIHISSRLTESIDELLSLIKDIYNEITSETK